MAALLMALLNEYDIEDLQSLSLTLKNFVSLK